MENHHGHTAANSGVTGKTLNGTDEEEIRNGRNNHLERGGGDQETSLTRTNREERLKLLKERQNEERLKKLEELKQNGIQAAKIREEQDLRRRKHFEEIGRKEDERRKQAEERRRLLEEERKAMMQSKWESKKQALAKAPDRTRPVFAFGSCTPRLVDNLVDGCLWKSQYNISSTSKEPPAKSAASAQDLHSQIKMSTSMYEWNQQRTTFNVGPTMSPRPGIAYRRSKTAELDPDRVFCGRRKTDLTPTFPIRREDGSTSSRSASRAGNTTSAGTRSGNATPSRPPSSMSSLMTSSTHSQVQMRPRTLTSRKSRPVSVHVTGVSGSDSSTPDRETKPTRPPVLMRKHVEKTDTPTAPVPLKALPRKKLADGETRPKTADTTKSHPKSTLEDKKIDTSTIKRAKPAPKKKELVEKPVDKDVEMGEGPKAVKTDEKGTAPVVHHTEVTANSAVAASPPPTVLAPSADDGFESLQENQAEIETVEQEPDFLSFVITKTHGLAETPTDKPSVHFESELAPGDDKEAESSDSFSSFVPAPIPDFQEHEQNGHNDAVGNTNPFGDSTEPKEMTNPFAFTVESPTVGNNNPFIDDTLDGAIGDAVSEGKPKLMTEEDAKAALADKRRLAREAQEREQARLEEEERLEEERQRLEIEEAERMAEISREMEDERLRLAIEEQKQKEVDEQKRRDEEEVARQERERDEREAAREAERIRQEMEERLKREEEERLERKRRVEAIMSRTRKGGTDSAKATTPVPDEVLSEEKFSNGILQHAHEDSLLPPAGNPVVNNNHYNNNNDFSSNTLIDFGDLSSSPTPPPQQSNGASNLINSSLQDLLS